MDDEIDDRLDERRIHQRATLRRALYRSRSHAILAGVLCIVAGAELARHAIASVRAHSIGSTTVFALASTIAIALSIFAARRAIALNRECHQNLDDLPTTDPDFSKLSDGSQQVTNLHEIR